MEIREALGIPTDGKIVIRISDSETQNARRKTQNLLIELSKASESDLANSIPYSRNGKYLKDGGEQKW